MTSLIRTATPADADQAIAVAVLAFGTDPVMRWALPDPQQYLTHAPAYLRALADRAFVLRSAYYVDGFCGAAFWLAPGVEFDQDTVVATLRRAVAPDRLGELFALMERAGQYHPDGPHWYLPFMGVEAQYQRRGLGAALMRHALIACDRDRTLAYLEASSQESVALFERHGFTLLGKLQSGSSPPLFPMLRPPR